MRYAPSLAAMVALTTLLAGCPREPDDTGDTGDTDTGDTDTGDTDSGDTDTDSGDTDTDSGDTDSGDTGDTGDTGTTVTDRLLMITEIVDGDMFSAEDADTNTSNGPFDRVPRFVEITNVGDTTEDLSDFTLGLWRNGTTLEPIALSGTLAAGESFVVSIENELEGVGVTGFFQVYGVEPDLQVKKSGHNGDDAYAVYFGAASGDGSNATLLDVYGVIGEDGTDKDWEYTDGFGCRTFNATVVPATTFTLGEWTIEQDLLRVGGAYADNAAELPLVLAYTTPGEWDADACPPAGPECTEATDCPTPTEVCLEAVCNPDLTCGTQPLEAGPLPDTTPGDCKQDFCDGTNGTPVLTNVDDPLADTFCIDNTCVDGTPTPVPQNQGNPLPSEDQTAGDCEELVCDGGVPTATNVDDPPANTECTTYVCTDGDPVPTQTPAGTALPEGEQTPEDCRELYCDENGDTQTRFVEDAPEDLDCETYSCDLTDGDVITAWPGNAKVLTDTEPGDCHDLVCKEGENATEEIVNDDDLPADTSCAVGQCVPSGEPSYDPDDPGVACDGEPGVCDGDGACVECVSDEQCGGSPGSCDLETNACILTVVSTVPDLDAVDVAVDTDIVITFSRAMNTSTVTFPSAPGACTGSVQLSFDGFESCVGFASATWSVGDTVVTLVPSEDLVHDQFYDLLVTTDVQSASGGSLAADYDALAFITETFAGTCGESLVISQVYGAGGNSGATYKNDFVVLYNPTDTDIPLTGWTLQYTSATGPSTGNNWLKNSLSGTVSAHGYFLVKLAGGSNGIDIPAADLTISTSPLNLSGTTGKIALFSGSPTIATACPTDATLVDFVGFGAPNCQEGAAPAPGPSTTNAIYRQSSGCDDTDENADDFVAAPVLPAWTSSSPKATCSCEGDTLANGLGSASIEADYCKMLAPTTLTATRNTATSAVTGEIFEDPFTGQTTGALYKAQVGYGPLGSDPRRQSSWVFFDAPFTADAGNNDEHSGSIVAPVVSAATDYAYVYRFEIAGGWTYCDLGGSGSNADLDFDPSDLGVLTVNP